MLHFSRSNRPSPFRVVLLTVLSFLAGPQVSFSQDSPPVLPIRTLPDVDKSVEPLPPVAIPDDPPPYEGALIDIPIILEPPDIIVVEILEALPGRPITGERIIRHDGTISLGFYGEVHVRGLTTSQAKVKIINHMRKYLNDNVLGLTRVYMEDSKVDPLPKPGTRIPGKFLVEPDKRPFEKPDVDRPATPTTPDQEKPVDAAPAKPAFEIIPLQTQAVSPSRREKRRHRIESKRQMTVIASKSPRSSEQEPAKPEPEKIVEGELVYIDPVETERVFVDIVSHNSKIYYVQGDVANPGRLPIVGKETVLDVLINAGGVLSTAEPTNIHLYRPASGGKPVKDYQIDYAAIVRGDKKANLQIFPDDRLYVGRNPIVQKTIDMERAAAPINSALNSALIYSFASRSLGAGPTGIGAMSRIERDEALKRWVEFFWKFTSNEGISLLDEKSLRDSLLKKLEPSPDSKEAKPPSQ